MKRIIITGFALLGFLRISAQTTPTDSTTYKNKKLKNWMKLIWFPVTISRMVITLPLLVVLVPKNLPMYLIISMLLS